MNCLIQQPFGYGFHVMASSGAKQPQPSFDPGYGRQLFNSRL